MQILGLILCGGRSSRFGSDKALALYAGRPMIDHVRDALARQVDDILICGRTSCEHPYVLDRPAGGMGPLGGLNAGLHAAFTRGFDAVLSVPCDTPQLPDTLVSLLAGSQAAYLEDCPVIGFWPSVLAAALDDHMRDDPRRSMKGWALRAGARAVPSRVPIENVNVPADLDRIAGLKNASPDGGV